MDQREGSLIWGYWDITLHITYTLLLLLHTYTTTPSSRLLGFYYFLLYCQTCFVNYFFFLLSFFSGVLSLTCNFDIQTLARHGSTVDGRNLLQKNNNTLPFTMDRGGQLHSPSIHRRWQHLLLSRDTGRGQHMGRSGNESGRRPAILVR